MSELFCEREREREREYTRELGEREEDEMSRRELETGSRMRGNREGEKQTDQANWSPIAAKAIEYHYWGSGRVNYRIEGAESEREIESE